MMVASEPTADSPLLPDDHATAASAPGGLESSIGPVDGAAPEPVDGPDQLTGSVAFSPFADLPEAVRGRIVDWAAKALGLLPPTQIPPALSRVARFTPGKRARLGGTLLGQTVADDASFRAAVADFARHECESAIAAAVDDVTAAAGAYLLRRPENNALLARAVEVEAADQLRGRIAELERGMMRLRSRVDTLTGERDQARAQLTAAAPELDRELDKLRGRLREQGNRLRAAELAGAAAAAEPSRRIADLEARLARTERSLADWQARAATATDRADRTERSLAAQRDAAGRERAAADRRLDLLLSTLEGAAAGLRRQLNLTTGGADPADVVAGRLPTAVVVRTRAADAAMLNDWLVLPFAHLVVDGYNVTKTGYPDLSLADQRDRLVRSLAGLSARTSAEVTVVFDGAAVTTSAPAGRGIRVLFSPPGVIADDVIRRLVAEEPAGRVVVVASSDREIVTGVTRSGARTVNSGVLLELLGR